MTALVALLIVLSATTRLPLAQHCGRSTMLRERNLFVLKARRGRPTERLQALTLHVHVREQDLSHFNGHDGTAGARSVERLLDVLGRCEALQALVQAMDDGPRQVEQLVKSKSKDGTHTLEVPDVTVQWQVSDESGLHSVLQRLPSDRDGSESSERNTALGSARATGKFRPLPMRPLVVAVWMYPPHVEIPLTEERIPVSDIVKQDFFSEAGNDDIKDNANVSSEDGIDDLH